MPVYVYNVLYTGCTFKWKPHATVEHEEKRKRIEYSTLLRYVTHHTNLAANAHPIGVEGLKPPQCVSEPGKM